MHIEYKRGQVSNLKPVEDSKAVECMVGLTKVRLPADLADKAADVDDVLVAGKPKDELFYADALKNLTRGDLSQLDNTNYILVMGAFFFLWIVCGVQSYNAHKVGNDLGSTGLAILSVASMVGAGVILHRVVEIIKAGTRLKFRPE